jgi:hypothetical protein
MSRKRKPGVKQTHDELVQHLRDEIVLLRAGGESFDAGSTPHAKVLAGRIRLLVYDSGSGRSLRQWLREKDRLTFVDTSHPPLPPGAVMISAGLAVIRMGTDEITYASPLDSRERRPPPAFGRWWSNPVLDDNGGNRLNRRDLVLGLAHQGGGAHVDDLERAYAAVARANSLGWEFTINGVTVAAPSPIDANVRQIAWELQTTIEEQLSELLAAET